ncbi:MAG: thioredoxin domain-containing protein [Dokdonella sp.]|uniref:thioredoxin domain-containing protein n=1 Tax=Dokdonella sp. TaxID=2291710 RepID=UPI0032660720
MSNRLALETSPYLRQHADNPVDWWPWSDEALAAARAQRKPILLSIGYAACHWCHVMAHESFEDEATAHVMNALYINIKVDREERPDIDKVYQLAHQALTRRGGGWPLTVILAPDDLLPFFAGTYFPKVPRQGMPAFVQVLEGVHAWFDSKADEVTAQNGALAKFLAGHGRDAASQDALDDAPIHRALEQIAASFDQINGGRRGGPKFPHASEIELLLAFARRGDEDDRAAHAHMARRTLERMADRGLTDHLGGGFFRYCVDDHWEIPHFEKMLYDNAQLLPVYAHASVALAVPAFGDDTRACASWLVHDMQAPEGAFFSSLDADSEGEEGRYYVWQRSEVNALLTADECAVAVARFGLDGAPNFEGHAWHLVIAASLDEVSAATGVSRIDVEARLATARAKLLAARSLRVRPGLDDKILTAWNALAIGGAARAARWLDDQPLLAQSERALDFLHANVWKHDRLYACHAGGVARFGAYLDDHAFLLDALLALLQVRWNPRDLDFAIALADALLARFQDPDGGGFFFTAHDAEVLPQRPKPWMDDSLPSGNGVAARALLKLGYLLGEPRYLDAAERTLRAAWRTLVDLPHACCSLLLALDDYLRPTAHLVVRHRSPEAIAAWSDASIMHRRNGVDVYMIPTDAPQLPGVLAAPTDAAIVAYFCQGTSCGPPIVDVEEFKALSAPRSAT